ncbi:MAG TPA: T9SS type A sorting domain-containing protein [Brumimicrobium sp.]|nr:T9SS type A sorting domain-containing protein [Brumimicrobium sp.]
MKKAIFTLILALTCNYISAQDGLNDPTFNSGIDAWYHQNSPVNSSAIQADGKIIIGGMFNSYDGVPRKSIARINPDGSLDNSFAPGTLGIDQGLIRAICIQPDGKIIIGGSFNSYNGTSSNGIARLNADGSLDNTFQVGTGLGFNSNYDGLNSIALQTDGKIVVGGVFSEYNGVNRTGNARLNADGSLDLNFDDQLVGSYPYVKSIVIQPDGKIIFAGRDFQVQYQQAKYIVRVNEDGTIDNTFTVYDGNISSFVKEIRDISILSDGSLVILYYFNYTIGSTLYERAHLKKVSSTGTTIYDHSFLNDIIGNKILIQVDGKIVMGGNVIRRFHPDLTIDTSFVNWSGGNVYTLSLQPDGKIILGGYFNTFHGGLNSNINIARTYNCSPSPITFTDTQVACGYYVWKDNITYTTNNNTATHTLSNAIGCDSLLTLDLTIISSIDNTISNANGTLTANQHGASYQWVDCANGNAPIQGETAQTFTPSQDGKYAVQITAGTCTEITTCEDFVMSDLSAQHFEKNRFGLFPNPSSTSFTISNAPIGAQFSVLDVTGKTIYESIVTDNQTVVQSSHFNNGIYFVHVEHNGSKSVEKLMISK